MDLTGSTDASSQQECQDRSESCQGPAQKTAFSNMRRRLCQVNRKLREANAATSTRTAEQQCSSMLRLRSHTLDTAELPSAHAGRPGPLGAGQAPLRREYCIRTGVRLSCAEGLRVWVLVLLLNTLRALTTVFILETLEVFSPSGSSPVQAGDLWITFAVRL